MATTDQVLRDLTAFHDAHIQRFAGLGGNLARFLSRYSLDRCYVMDDFLGDTLDSNLWTTANGGGTAAASFTIASGANGTIAAATGTDATAANRTVNLYGPAIYAGDNNCMMEVRMKLGAVDHCYLAVGFLVTSSDPSAPQTIGYPVTDIDTPAFETNTTDAVLVAIDLTQTLKTLAMCTLGSGALNTGAKDALGTIAPSADTYMRFRVGLIGNTAVANLDGKRGTSYNVSRDSAVEGGSKLRPYIYVGGMTNTSLVPTIDYVAIMADRA